MTLSEELRHLAQLRDDGSITQFEYAVAKTQVLERGTSKRPSNRDEATSRRRARVGLVAVLALVAAAITVVAVATSTAEQNDTREASTESSADARTEARAAFVFWVNELNAESRALETRLRETNDAYAWYVDSAAHIEQMADELNASVHVPDEAASEFQRVAEALDRLGANLRELAATPEGSTVAVDLLYESRALTEELMSASDRLRAALS